MTMTKLGLIAALSLGGSGIVLSLPGMAQEADGLVQTETSLVQITGVRIETSEAGLNLVFDTAGGTLAAPATQIVGNALVSDIPNAVLALPGGESFEQFAPAEGIALVAVTNEPGDTVRVAITGTDAPPAIAVTATGLAVTLGATPAGTEDDAIQVVVTGEQDEGYNPSSASAATRTETPLRDIPQSIQVIPQEIIRDQQAPNLTEVLRNVGITQGVNPSGRGAFSLPVIRGFDSSDNVVRDGLADPTSRFAGPDLSNIERVEVLRGPASVLYGQSVPGGTINLVTEKPLSEPTYSVGFSAGNYNFYRGDVDLSGPLNEERTVLYRLNLAAQTTESFVDFFDRQQYQIAPALSWQISDRTALNLSGEYLYRPSVAAQVGLPVEGSILPNPNGELSRSLNVSGPFGETDYNIYRVGYSLDHRFSDTWSLRNAFRYSDVQRDNRLAAFGTSLAADGRTLTLDRSTGSDTEQFYNFDTYAVGEFATGSLQHQLVAGINLTRQYYSFGGGSLAPSTIDIFNPVYEQPSGPIDPDSLYGGNSATNALGLYVQDQVELLDNLNLLVGLRFDTFEQTSANFITDTDQRRSGSAFSPRVGLVYQPVDPISLYASYSRSFLPVAGATFSGELFDPERSTQYEVGVKADITNRLSASLALYQLTRSNVETDDPVNLGFSIQTGEQRSRGIELNLAGEILPGWNIIGAYAYTNAVITEDNNLPEGNQLRLVPNHIFNVWSTYELQEGDLRGLGFGLGLVLVGDRPGDFANSFVLPSYLRTDAAVFYNRDRLRLALNVRNLFDVEYFETASNRLNVFPGDPLTIVGSVSWEF
ncbi:TonB-dependent siderophore receptor [Leptolyngbya sp. CCNP1308]|uniref:TonB-dependent siderophore receptor n=1 Tax=Leptolyngbya sp. CCNP1308 TaxID=3110255 RepID=UPI002B1F0D99|nr:TonB-dependent siderophore receptor [Leptolyngbya sp. CCNP1308]MEA5451759.1 TonB-dependent siderophore receptor [Leptolyngbya sp. CCNP1308]